MPGSLRDLDLRVDLGLGEGRSGGSREMRYELKLFLIVVKFHNLPADETRWKWEDGGEWRGKVWVPWGER